MRRTNLCLIVDLRTRKAVRSRRPGAARAGSIVRFADWFAALRAGLRSAYGHGDRSEALRDDKQTEK